MISSGEGADCDPVIPEIDTYCLISVVLLFLVKMFLLVSTYDCLKQQDKSRDDSWRWWFMIVELLKKF
jgi:hypothetical protein